MNLTQFAIDKNRITLTALLIIVVAGLDTYRRLPRAEDPGFTIRTAVVVTRFPGAGICTLASISAARAMLSLRRRPLWS